MLKSLELKNFRCFEDLKVSDMSRINLIAGKNNVGKTTFLEALYQLSHLSWRYAILELDHNRGKIEKNLKQGPWIEPPWINLFRNFDTSQIIEMLFEHSETGKKELSIKNISDQREILKIVTDNLSEYFREFKAVSMSDMLKFDLSNQNDNKNIYLLDSTQITNWEKLIEQLLNPENDYEKMIWTLFDSGCKNLLQGFNNTEITDTLKDSIIDNLNKILEKKNFFLSNVISKFKFEIDLERSVLSRVRNQDKNETIKMNRRLLEIIFPDSIVSHSAAFYWLFNKEDLFCYPTSIPSTFNSYYLVSRQRTLLESIAEMFGRMEIEGRQDEILEPLRLIEPRLESIKSIPIRNEIIIHGKLKGIKRLVPLYLMGDGMVRLFEFVLGISVNQKNVILIDEIENGIHHSMLEKVWKVIAKTARMNDVQIFATTHSYECIKAAHRAFSEDEKYDFRLHRLERVKEKIKSVTYDKETLEAAIDMGLEVR